MCWEGDKFTTVSSLTQAINLSHHKKKKKSTFLYEKYENFFSLRENLGFMRVCGDVWGAEMAAGSRRINSRVCTRSGRARRFGLARRMAQA